MSATAAAAANFNNFAVLAILGGAVMVTVAIVTPIMYTNSIPETAETELTLSSDHLENWQAIPGENEV